MDGPEYSLGEQAEIHGDVMSPDRALEHYVGGNDENRTTGWFFTPSSLVSNL